MVVTKDTGIDFVAGDTGATLQVTVQDADSESAVDLTSGSATLYWVIVHPGTGAVAVSKSAAMTLTTPASGIVSYTWQANDLDPPPGIEGIPAEYKVFAEVVATLSGGGTLTSLDPMDFDVRQRLSA